MPLQAYKIPITREDGFVIQLDKNDLAHRDVLAHMAHGQYYEHETTLFISKVLRPGDVFIDIGANAGYFAMLAHSLIGGSGFVLALEANPRSADLIRSTAALNSAQAIAVEQVAVSDRTGNIVFTTGTGDSNGGVVPGKDPADPAALIVGQPWSEYVVECDTLDALVSRHGIQRVKVIKIDTEGHELSVLMGAAGLLRKGLVDFIVCELNLPGLERNGTNQRALREFAHRYGYHAFLLDHDGHLPKWVPQEADIVQEFTCNFLLAKPDALAGYWPQILNAPAAVRISAKR